ncbi:MAG: hypothetical protein JWM14_3422, partial [Chitinophagaceae bacterium]|nr:hypothetical protein [Chitinophagaceae bacterium]
MKTILIFLILFTPFFLYGQNRLKQKTQKQYNSSRRLTSQIVEDFDKDGYLIK